jgi:sugar phosphate isomerase/epimerase
MAIKLAFSTVACPDWDLKKVAAAAKEYGYNGIELRTLGRDDSSLASDPWALDPAETAKVLAGEGIEPMCLSTSLSLHHSSYDASYKAVWQTVRSIELAAKLGCPAVRVFGNEVAPGENRRTVAPRIAAHVKQIIEQAGDHGVRLLFENGGSWCTARDWWLVFNLLDHPMPGLVWNVANAAAAGEGPAVSVNVVNSRIVIGKVKDTVVGEGSGFVPLGEGTADVQHFVKRLMGIGFDGYITFEWDKAWLPTLAPAEEVLPQARETLAGWIGQVKESEDAAAAKKAKRAAKEAPKKRAELQAK